MPRVIGSKNNQTGVRKVAKGFQVDFKNCPFATVKRRLFSERFYGSLDAARRAAEAYQKEEFARLLLLFRQRLLEATPPPLPDSFVVPPATYRTRFEGKIARHQATNILYYQVSWSGGKCKGYGRYFSVTKLGDAAAKAKAIRHRNQVARLHGLTTQYVEPYYVRGQEVPVSDRQRIAGFFDGDGSVGVYPASKCTTGLCVASLGQNSFTRLPEILQLVHHYYGGGIVHTVYPLERGHKDAYRWAVSQQQHTKVFLQDIQPYVLIKAPQVNAALRFMSMPDKHIDNPEVSELMLAMKQMKATWTGYGSVPIEANKLGKEYLAGLFDAEGCVKESSGCISAQLAQCSPPFLNAFQSVFGGRIDNNRTVNLVSETAEKFFREIYPFSIEKRQQIRVALEFQERRRLRDTIGKEFPTVSSLVRQEDNKNTNLLLKSLKRQ